MKNSFVVKLAAVALLAFGSFSQAQDDTPAPDAVADAPAAAVVDAADVQESVSDTALPEGSVEGQVIAPAEPVADVMPLNQGIVIGTPSDCVGCGQVTPFANATVMNPVVNTSGCCGGCNTGCNTGCCGTQMSYVQPASYAYPQQNSYVQQVSYVQPVQTGCSTCANSGVVSPVAYQTPVTQQSFGSVISAAPIVTSGIPATTVSAPTSIVTPAPTPVYTQPYTTGPITTPTAGCASCSGNIVSNPAPVTYGTVTPSIGTVTSSYGTVTPSFGTTSYSTPVTTTGCTNCPQQRRLIGGVRLLRNRR